jgi:hypothetical protein
MDILSGGLLRAFQGLISATPTLIIGLFIASVLRFYLGREGTLRLFGGASLKSLPQAWLVGMLLPVCSIGVLPIIREMRRCGIRPGAITAFALSAPLFNPLSLLYGLTLSRPIVIVGFEVGSLLVVTIVGIIWDRSVSTEGIDLPKEPGIIGLPRIFACGSYACRELVGPTGILMAIALAGLFLLGVLLPHGALQGSVEQTDRLAPLKMAAVSIPIYATPMLTMSQLGMMFAHGNSPGASFCLLLLGTGINLATLVWISRSYGNRATTIWFLSLMVVVLSVAYAIDRPLIPPGIEPAGHTHAFDIYTSPFTTGTNITFSSFIDRVQTSVDVVGMASLAILGMFFVIGIASRVFSPAEIANESPQDAVLYAGTGIHRVVSSRVVGLTCLAGLIGFSVVGCFAYYPAPEETLEEMRLARTEVLTAASSRDFPNGLRWIPVLDEWSRKLEVGYAIRYFELRPYQQMQARLLRDKLESLEHAIEHAREASSSNDASKRATYEAELLEIDQLRFAISKNSRRLSTAFGD